MYTMKHNQAMLLGLVTSMNINHFFIFTHWPLADMDAVLKM